MENNSVKIPFWRTVGSAYGVLFKNIGEFLRLTWLLMIINYGINFGIGYYATFSQQLSLLYLPYIVQIVTLSIFAVAWHRMVLLDETHSGSWAYVAFGKRDLLFILTSIGFTVAIYGAAFVIGSAIAENTGGEAGAKALWVFFSLVLLGIIAGRLAIIYPKIATDKEFNLSSCWQASKGNALRLYFGNFLVMFPFVLIGNIFSKAAASLVSNPENLSTGIAVEFIGSIFVFGAIGVVAGFLSLSYKILIPDYANSDMEI